MTVNIDITPEDLLALGTDVSEAGPGRRLRSEDFLRRLILVCQGESRRKAEELQLFTQIFDEWTEPDEIESDKELFPDSEDRG
jgi:hypothetical protein